MLECRLLWLALAISVLLAGVRLIVPAVAAYATYTVLQQVMFGATVVLASIVSTVTPSMFGPAYVAKVMKAAYAMSVILAALLLYTAATDRFAASGGWMLLPVLGSGPVLSLIHRRGRNRD